MAQTSKTFRIFVSSTFSDLKVERNALQERVFPRLRELCMAHGCRFQAIDLRWGVSEEATSDQKTMAICLEEIARCQRVTPRPNFIVLLGDRYGWWPLPAEIPAEEFEQIERRISDTASKELLNQWYWRDDNAVPAVYCLQPRTGEFLNYEVWEGRVERPLREVLRQAIAGLNLNDEQRLKYGASATEQEIVRGALKVPDAREHVFCFFRSIANVPQDGRARDFLDLDPGGHPDEGAHQQLNDLKTRLRQQLPGNIKDYRAEWGADGITQAHIDQLCADVYQSLSRIIEQQIEQIEERDALEQEIETHQVFGRERVKFFTGREDSLQAIANYVRGEECHPLVVWGESGSGKSALLARAVLQVQEVEPGTAIIARFIGATPESSNARALLESLCQQIYQVFDFEAQKQRRLDESAGLTDEESRKQHQAIAAEYSIPAILILKRFCAVSAIPRFVTNCKLLLL